MPMPQEIRADMTSAKQNTHPPAKPALLPTAVRALEEAETRRKKADLAATTRAREVGGREGPEPTRYGDWEKNGIISDF